MDLIFESQLQGTKMEPKLTVDLGYWVIGTAIWAVGRTNLQLS